MLSSSLALALSALAASQTIETRPHAQQAYVLQDLGSLEDLGESQAIAVNDLGEVVGSGMSSSAGRVPFYWSKGTGFIKISDLFGFALDINRKGQVVGWISRQGNSHGFLWQRESGLVDLGSFLPIAINDRGDMAGQCQIGSAEPCLMTAGGIRTLDIPPGGLGIARRMNERGDVLGSVVFSGGPAVVAVWRRNSQGFTILPAPAEPGFRDIYAIGINDRRTVVGTMTLADGPDDVFQPVIWRRDGPWAAYDSLPGQSLDVNNSGVIILHLRAHGAAALDSRRGILRVLPSPDGWRALVSDINERGQIAGLIYDGSGRSHAVLWTLERRRHKSSH
jgi:probable HAF family extracellular repeat protein